MTAVQHWGRKESLIWPPRGNLSTLAAFFAALLATSLLIYVRYERNLSPLGRHYLPYHIRSATLGQLHPTDVYQLLFITDRRSLRPALESDVERGLGAIRKAMSSESGSPDWEHADRSSSLRPRWCSRQCFEPQPG